MKNNKKNGKIFHDKKKEYNITARRRRGAWGAEPPTI